MLKTPGINRPKLAPVLAHRRTTHAHGPGVISGRAAKNCGNGFHIKVPFDLGLVAHSAASRLYRIQRLRPNEMVI